MRINPIQYNYNNYYNQYNIRKTPYKSQPQAITFTSEGHSSKYYAAKAYARKMQIKSFFIPQTIRNFNLDKLDGIQEGLKTFDGLSMKEVVFTLNNLLAVATTRGCENQCLHCYIGAKPNNDNNSNNIVTKMTWEDFLQITNDIKELKKRLPVSPVERPIYHSDLFFDSDGLDLVLYDKNKKPHDFTEMLTPMYSVFESGLLFDTGGWNPKNTVKQERAEKIVDFFKDVTKRNKMHQINLSIHPFDPIYVKAREQGYDPEKYTPQPEELDNIYNGETTGEKLYRIYINKMANMLYTFTPINSSAPFHTLSRTANFNDENMHFFKEEDLDINNINILKNLEMRYKADLNGKQKHIKKRWQIDLNLKTYHNLLNRSETELIPTGRYLGLYKSRNPEMNIHSIKNKSPLYKNSVAMDKNRVLNFDKMVDAHFMRIIDANGKVYLYDYFKMIPTEIQLNINTKDKETPRFNTKIENYTITKDLINNKK